MLKAGTGSIQISIPRGFFPAMSVQVDQNLARPICDDHIWMTLRPSLTWLIRIFELGIVGETVPFGTSKCCGQDLSAQSLFTGPTFALENHNVETRFIIMQGRPPNQYTPHMEYLAAFGPLWGFLCRKVFQHHGSPWTMEHLGHGSTLKIQVSVADLSGGHQVQVTAGRKIPYDLKFIAGKITFL